MPAVSTFTQYGTNAQADLIPFLKSVGGGKYSDGLVPPSGIAPRIAMSANVRSPFLNAVWLTPGGGTIIPQFDTSYPNFGFNNGFTFGNDGTKLTPPISGMYVVHFTVFTASVAGGSVSAFATGDSVIVTANYTQGFYWLLMNQIFGTDGNWSAGGSFIIPLDLSTAGQGLTDRSFFQLQASASGPGAGPYPLGIYVLAHFVSHL